MRLTLQDLEAEPLILFFKLKHIQQLLLERYVLTMIRSLLDVLKLISVVKKVYVLHDIMKVMLAMYPLNVRMVHIASKKYVLYIL
jgi:hypothetical protein